VNTAFVSCWDIIYYGEIQLGSNLQTLQVRAACAPRVPPPSPPLSDALLRGISSTAPAFAQTPGLRLFNLLTRLSQVILDTGSSDLWVFGSTCTNCPSGTNKYDHSGSSDYVAKGADFSIQ
jgi:hypothetical protein